MQKRAYLLLTLLLAGIGELAALDGHLGIVLSFSGTASIDAFGKGVFIPVQQGDALYRDTVLKTGPSGSMILRLDRAQLTVPPASTVGVEELLASMEKRRALVWFQSALAVIGNLVRTGAEQGEEVALGSRGWDVEESGQQFEWAQEKDEDELAWKAARKLCQEGDFYATLQQLLAINDPDGLDGALPGEFDYLAGACYFQLGNYGDAEARLKRAYASAAVARPPSSAPPYRHNLLFQLGAAGYLLGHEAEAAERLQALLDMHPPRQIRPYVYLFLIRSLRDCGRNREARKRLDEAIEEFQGTSLATEFGQLSAH